MLFRIILYPQYLPCVLLTNIVKCILIHILFNWKFIYGWMLAHPKMSLIALFFNPSYLQIIQYTYVLLLIIILSVHYYFVYTHKQIPPYFWFLLTFCLFILTIYTSPCVPPEVLTRMHGDDNTINIPCLHVLLHHCTEMMFIYSIVEIVMGYASRICKKWRNE